MFKNIKDLWLYFWGKRFFRFLLVGGINSLFGYGVYALFVFLGFDYKIAALIGTILGVLFNFLTTGRIVFESTNNLLIFKFIGVYVITYFLNIGLIKIFLLLGLNAFASGAVSLVPMAIISFVLNKIFVFKRIKAV